MFLPHLRVEESPILGLKEVWLASGRSAWACRHVMFSLSSPHHAFNVKLPPLSLTEHV